MIPVDPPITAPVSVDLDRDECLRLLATATIGRIVVTDRALPAAYPVPFLLDDEEVVFRVPAAGRLGAAVAGKVVGFQADELDQHSRTGWSILAVGEAYEVVDTERLTDLADRLPEPWITETALRTLAISLQRLTGRRIHQYPG